MQIRKGLLITILGLSLSTAWSTPAPQASEQSRHGMARFHHCHSHHGGVVHLLTKEQRLELSKIKQANHQQIKSLIKEKKALQAQLNGLIATPGTSWEQLNPIIEKIAANNAVIIKTVAKNRYDVFKQFGVLLPNHFRIK